MPKPAIDEKPAYGVKDIPPPRDIHVIVLQLWSLVMLLGPGSDEFSAKALKLRCP